ncbi:MAG: ATP synthase subunit I [Bacillota bacterium]|uniref:ATP synthase subunit I n=1 Tax=Desulfurispora thermophila TaxID=265470 RepID=UPI00036DB3EB|nr:ATP synthase subunit I [Desulfurispora thermophila]
MPKQKGSLEELDRQISVTLRACGLAILLLALPVAVWPQDGLLRGILLGLAAGTYNMYTLGNRVRQIAVLTGDAAKGAMKRGLAMRLGLIVAVLYFAWQSGLFNLYGVGAGLLVPSLIATVSGIVLALRQVSQDG